MDTITIGFDAKRIVSNATGLGNYCRTLVNGLSVSDGLNLRLYAPSTGNEELSKKVVRSRNVSFVYPDGWHTIIGKKLWRAGGLRGGGGIITDLLADHIQLYHGLSGELPRGIRKKGIPTVVTIHDLIFMRHPEWYHSIDARIYEWKFRQTLKEADRIIAISECTKRDILHYASVDEQRISVIYQGYSPKFLSEATNEERKRLNTFYKLPKQYMLFVGTVEERKNALLAVKALPLLPPDLSLVIVGTPTRYERQLVAYAKKQGLTDRLHLLHYVPDNHLPAIYAQAAVFVYPARYEGFGIPIIEAISCGLPVVAATGSCLEEAGGPHNLYVNPDDADAFADAVRQSLPGAEGREQRITRSREYIRRFNPDVAAHNVAQVYLHLLAEKAKKNN
ncbi:MAG: glycosyltransferase family 4 protein [Prevotella sp.]|nr:glycosyltransferase family 4 protein [Prevotella sp.]